jgi:regulator of replication initiation timing
VLVGRIKKEGIIMLEKLKDNLITKINELKAKNNTLEIENELLRDKRLDELIKSLDKQNHYEELEEENKKLKIKNQQLREVIKELSNVKNKR